MDKEKDVINITSGEPTQTKKKKKHKGLKIFFIVLAAIIVLPVAAAYICFFDNGKSNVKADTSYNAKDIFVGAFRDSFDDTVTTKKCDINISASSFNQLLSNALKDGTKDDATLDDIFTGVKIETKDKEYTFILDINLKVIFQTRLYITTTFSEESIAEKGDCIIFNISNVKLGRISGLLNIVKSVAPNLLNNKTLNKAFKSFGLSFESDIDNNRIIYPKANFANDIISKTKSDEPLYNAAIKQIFDLEIEGNSINFAKEGLIGEFDLAEYETNDEYVTVEKENDFDYLATKNLVTTMINDGTIGKNYTGKDEQGNELTLHQDLFEYVLRGYDETRVALNDYFVDKDGSLANYGIPSYKGYNGSLFSDTHEEGKIYRPSKSLKQLIEEQVDVSTLAYTNHIAEINEEMLSNAIGSSSIIGDTYLLAGRKDNSYKITPFIISDAYVNILSNTIKIVVNVDVNGYKTSVCVNSTYESFDVNNYAVSLKVDEIYFGNVEVSEEFEDAIFDTIKEGFKNEEVFSFDKENSIIKLVCNDSIPEEAKMVISSLGTPKITFSGESLADDGKISVDIKRS